MTWPENLEEWLSKQSDYASTLPSELEEQKKIINRYIQIISGELKKNDDSTLRRFFYMLLKEIDITHDNEGILANNSARKAKGERSNPSYSDDLNRIIRNKIKCLNTTNTRKILYSLDGESFGCIDSIELIDNKLSITFVGIDDTLKDAPSIGLKALSNRITKLKQ